MLGLIAVLWSNHGDILGTQHCFLFSSQENELQDFLQENKHLNLQLFNNSPKASGYEKVRGKLASLFNIPMLQKSMLSHQKVKQILFLGVD